MGVLAVNLVVSARLRVLQCECDLRLAGPLPADRATRRGKPDLLPDTTF